MVGTINLAGDVGTECPTVGRTIRTTPLLDDTETWQICNFTMDAYSIHLDLVKFV